MNSTNKNGIEHFCHHVAHYPPHGISVKKIKQIIVKKYALFERSEFRIF